MSDNIVRPEWPKARPRPVRPYDMTAHVFVDRGTIRVLGIDAATANRVLAHFACERVTDPSPARMVRWMRCVLPMCGVGYLSSKRPSTWVSG